MHTVTTSQPHYVTCGPGKVAVLVKNIAAVADSFHLRVCFFHHICIYMCYIWRPVVLFGRVHCKKCVLKHFETVCQLYYYMCALSLSCAKSCIHRSRSVLRTKPALSYVARNLNVDMSSTCCWVCNMTSFLCCVRTGKMPGGIAWKNVAVYTPSSGRSWIAVLHLPEHSS